MSSNLLFLLLLIASLPLGLGAQEIPARITSTAAAPYMAFQVDKEARVKSGVPPRYPWSLHSSRVEGEVLAQFVVDDKGKPNMETFMVVRSSHAEFTQAVRRAVETLVFYPAEVEGKKVRQLVQQPYQFSLGR